MDLIWGEQALKTGEERIGGKAWGLAKLSRTGSPVPPWFVVPTEWFRLHLSQNDLPCLLERLLSRLATLDPSDRTARTTFSQQAQRLRTAVEAAPLAAGFVFKLADALDRLGHASVAVRSSMVGEDSASHSFAGQLDSYLFQNGVDEVGRSIRRCWASAFSDCAVIYRLHSGLPLRRVQMGVVIQQMIDGQVSGVLFTANPITGQRQECLLTAAWGLGEGIVSGVCNTDEIAWSHGGAERSYKVAHKDIQVIRASNGSRDTIKSTVAHADQDQRCLSSAQVEQICEEGLRVAKTLGAPQDIEWTMAKGNIYFLQTRPITSLRLNHSGKGPRVVWDNSNIQESYFGVTTPLTFSFASQGYYTVYKQMMHVMGIPRSIIQAHEPILRNLLGFIRGRIYYNINNWYRGLLLLPSFQKNKEDMERMMGLKEPVDFIEDQILTSREKWRRLPRLLFALLRLKYRFAGLRRAVPKFLSDFEAMYTSVHRVSLQTSSISELMEVLKRLHHYMLENWRTPIVNDFFVMMTNGRLRRWLKKVGFEDADSLQNELMGGEECLDSAEPARQLMRMAQDARRHHKLSAILCAGTPDGVLKKIRTLYPAFASTLDDFIEQCGDRCIGELKLETISLREDPTFLIHVLRNYLNHQDLDPGRILIRQKIRRAKAETRVMAKSGLLGRWRFQRVLAKGRNAVRDRESMRLCRSRMFGLFRDIYGAIGERLTEAGRLKNPRDIFYLTTEEIEAYCEGRAGSTDLASLARIRQAEFAEYQKQELPHRFETWGPVYHDNAYDHRSAVTTDPCASTLSGVGCCPGIVESEVKIIVSPRQELSVNKKIMVAMQTDPGWAPLFPTVSGMLVERGSTLSHSAVVARELGIPTIVGIPGITQILQDGETVRMDGAQGLVWRVEGKR